MNPPAGKPRARKPAPKKPVQLNLRRTPVWPEEDELREQPESGFWKWFLLVFVLHVIAFIVLILVFNHRAAPTEPQFISLVPPGEDVKGTPGQMAAKKVAPSTMAPSHVEVATPTPTPPKPVTPPKPKVQQPVQPPTPKPPPIIAHDSPTPITPVKPKPTPPKPPKVKIDLSKLVDAPSDDQPAPKVKAKTPTKKPVKKHEDTPVADIDNDTPGLSREEVAQKLGAKLAPSGTEKADKTGINGSAHSKQSDFSDFYQSIHDQVMNKWTAPNLVDETAVDPVVQIHVDKDGAVPGDMVKLLRSSNNPAFDQSALEAARTMGHTLQPLPDGCPPDISITFNLRQQ